ncbi:hypothetical protein [Pseudomonas kurunegalensis]|uniref:hypothetical protein n=1 Tax=Pseudomonas kurunegalensis TaxID=485880 RepID=UPI0028939DD3|nr:hypothetical protein [Pseudomonas kurunegalensis]MDT3750470.1 hypothetical protein [Pseudomonas kurunegalensis]
MKFNDWVLEQGGVAAAAEKLGEKHSAVRSWFYAERPPKLLAAIKIIEASEGRLDFNGIYGPIAARLHGFKGAGE